jgi:integrase
MKSKLSKIYRGAPEGKKPRMDRYWYIDYEYYGERKQSRLGINRGKTVAAREELAKAAQAQVDEMIRRSFTKPQAEKKVKYPLNECLDKSIEDKKRIIANGSIKEYTTPLKFFYEQTDKMGLTGKDIRDIKKPVMKDILHGMVETRAQEAEKAGKKYSRAYNFRKYKANIGNLFEPYVDDDLLDKNPCDFNSPYKKPAPKLKMILDNNQRALVWNQLKDKDPAFMIYCKMVQHTSMRPAEILKLRIRDINLESQTVIAHSEIVKDRTGREVPIVDVLVPYLKALKMDKLPGTYFVFGQDFTPEQREKALREDKANRRWRRWIKFDKDKGGLGLDFNLYWLKDMGMEDKASDGISMDIVRDLAGHSSIRQSNTYLSKDLAARIKKQAEIDRLLQQQKDIQTLKRKTRDF